MGLRGFAAEMARGTAGVWRGIAEVVDPDDPSSRPTASAPTPEQAATPDDDHVVAGPLQAGESDGVEELPGRMVVPIDTWSRILEQVGHVHEAGQQLAEARERAARAETENRFLREQLGDLKKGRPRRSPAAPATPDPTTFDPTATDVTADTAPSRVDRARRRASGWLSP